MTDPRLRAGLLQIYDELAQDLAQLAPVCDLSGRCCRFQEYGHRLYISRTEAELLLQDGLPPGATIDDDSCPFQKGQLCTAREKRPFGCRVYFCDPKYAGQAEIMSEKYLARLRKLHGETGTPWDYGELHLFLREAASQAGLLATSEFPVPSD